MKRKSKLVEFYSCAVAGVKYADVQLSNVAAGDKLQLVWERANPVDPMAIRVQTYDGVKLGYIPRSDTALLHKYRTCGIKITTIVRGYFPANPSWEQLYIRCLAPSVFNTKATEVEL